MSNDDDPKPNLDPGGITAMQRIIAESTDPGGVTAMQRIIAESADPGGITAMQRIIAEIADPGGIVAMQRIIAEIADPGGIVSMQRRIAEMADPGGIVSMQRRIAEMMTTMLSVHEHVAKGATFDASLLLEHAARASLPTGLLESVRAFASMNDPALSLIPPDARSVCSQLLAASAVPSIMAFGALSVDLPTCVLSHLDDQNRFGSLAWLATTDEDEDEPRVVMAPWVVKAPTLEPPPAEQITINIRCEPKCMFCGHAMLAREQQITSTAPYDLVVSLAVAPVCATCMERSRKNPRYLLDQVSELARPRLQLIDGESTGDGVPRGIVHLVTRDDADDGHGD